MKQDNTPSPEKTQDDNALRSEDASEKTFVEPELKRHEKLPAVTGFSFSA